MCDRPQAYNFLYKRVFFCKEGEHQLVSVHLEIHAVQLRSQRLELGLVNRYQWHPLRYLLEYLLPLKPLIVKG